MRPLSDCRLYAFVDTGYLDGRSPENLAHLLCEGGADLIQFRAKDWPTDLIRSTAERILKITQSAGVNLVINDHFDIARDVGALFCHLGQEDFYGFSHVSQLPHRAMPERSSTRLSGSDQAVPVPLVGLSTHAPDQAEKAISAEAAYIAVGPVFATGTKPAAKPVTLEYVRWAARNVSIPWFAIGGITLSNIGDVIAAGARRVCVVSAILRAPDVVAACRSFRERLNRP